MARPILVSAARTVEGVCGSSRRNLCLRNGSGYRDASALQLCLVQLGYALLHILLRVKCHKAKAARSAGHLVQHDPSVHRTLGILCKNCKNWFHIRARGLQQKQRRMG